MAEGFGQLAGLVQIGDGCFGGERSGSPAGHGSKGNTLSSSRCQPWAVLTVRGRQAQAIGNLRATTKNGSMEAMDPYALTRLEIVSMADQLSAADG
jgi:hypothetical protein